MWPDSAQQDGNGLGKGGPECCLGATPRGERGEAIGMKGGGEWHAQCLDVGRMPPRHDDKLGSGQQDESGWGFAGGVNAGWASRWGDEQGALWAVIWMFIKMGSGVGDGTSQYPAGPGQRHFLKVRKQSAARGPKGEGELVGFWTHMPRESTPQNYLAKQPREVKFTSRTENYPAG